MHAESRRTVSAGSLHGHPTGMLAMALPCCSSGQTCPGRCATAACHHKMRAAPPSSSCTTLLVTMTAAHTWLALATTQCRGTITATVCARHGSRRTTHRTAAQGSCHVLFISESFDSPSRMRNACCYN